MVPVGVLVTGVSNGKVRWKEKAVTMRSAGVVSGAGEAFSEIALASTAGES